MKRSLAAQVMPGKRKRSVLGSIENTVVAGWLPWAKQDPTRTDLAVPANIAKQWPEYKSIFDRYGKELYALYCPTDDHAGTDAALAAFLDLFFEERGYQPMASCQDSYQSIRASWFGHLMPTVERATVAELLTSRRYVIVQGSPGTGKTMMPTELLRETLWWERTKHPVSSKHDV